MNGPDARPRGRLSLRSRLLAITLALLVAALLASTGLVIDQLQRELVRQLDERVEGIAAVAARLPGLPDAIGKDAEQPRRSMEQLWFPDVYVAVLSPDGQVAKVIRPATGPAPELPRLDTAAVAAHDGRPFALEATSGDETWRAVALPSTADTSGGSEGSVVVAGSRGDVDDAMGQLTKKVLLIDAAVLALLGLAGWFAVRGGLRPLRRIESTAAAIASGDLSRRVPQLAAPRTEIGRLSTSLNGMLDRIEAGNAARAETEQRMRRFIADVSHELRTPLAGIKGFTELYRMGGMPERADVDASMSRIEREAGRLIGLVEELLLLARLDEDADAAQTLQVTPMDLRTLAADALHDLRALDPTRPVTLTGPGGGPVAAAPVLGDEARLHQVTSNLVGNAVAHTPAGTPVRIGVGTRDGLAVLEFRDEGPGMTEDQAERAFDRFYRADKARARAQAGGGAGLGLAIVDSLVRAHGGRVEIHTGPGAGATFRILLPLYS
ncbi:MAG TPA: HAMP domain-containing sensor histidine kinase [Streptomyces sp.]